MFLVLGELPHPIFVSRVKRAEYMKVDFSTFTYCDDVYVIKTRPQLVFSLIVWKVEITIHFLNNSVNLFILDLHN